jgi:hypothetical protein
MMTPTAIKHASNQKQELSMVAIFVNRSGRNEQSQQRTFHRCFLPSFGSFGQTVSEEKIFLEINQSKTRMACGGHVCQLGQMNRNLVGSIYGMSSIKIAHFVPIC